MLWKWAREIVSALLYCHTVASVCHRDIKAENIMLNEAGEAILVDFGVSSLFENDDDSVKGTVGSMRYFSPEIVRTGGPKLVKGRATDVWALAVTLYNMASNKFPFNSLNVCDFKTELLEQEPDYSVIKDHKLEELLKLMFTKD